MKSPAAVQAARDAPKTQAVSVSQPGDACEVEADQAATAVVNGHSAPVNSGAQESPPSAPGAGQRLPESTRREMESAFGRRFDDVRVHADRHAGEMAQAWHANAFTMGRDIVFAPGAYAPSTSAGRQLIAHELAHVAQGSRGPAMRRQANPPTGWMSPETVERLTDDELDRHIKAVLDYGSKVKPGTPEAQFATDNLKLLQAEVAKRGYQSPVLVREAMISGADNVEIQVLAHKVKNNLLYTTLFSAGGPAPEVFKNYFKDRAEKPVQWILAAAKSARQLVQAAAPTDRAAAFTAIEQAAPKLTAAVLGERLLAVWVATQQFGDSIRAEVPGHSLEHLLVWMNKIWGLLEAPLVELSSLDPAKVQATGSTLPQLFEKLDKEFKDYQALIEKGQRNLRYIMIAVAVVQIATSVYGLRGLFVLPPGPPPTAAAPAVVGMSGGAAVLSGGIRISAGAIAWAEVIRKLQLAGLLLTSSGIQVGAVLKATGGGGPGAPSVGTPGTPGPGTGGTSTGPGGRPAPKVTGGANGKTAGTGGISKIDRVVDKTTGEAQTTIEGQVQPTLPARAGLEKELGPAIGGTDRAHLWGRIFGDEAAAGTLYAPSGFNRGVQLTLEKTLQQLQQEAAASGGQVWLKAASRSYGRNVLNGKALASVRYEFQVRLPSGQIGRTIRIDFEVAPPGTPVTPNRPGFTINAPFEGSVTP